jgi:hypothetical protein
MFKNWQVWATLLGIGLALFVGGWGGKWAYNANNQPTPDSTVWFIRVGVVVMVVGTLGILACLIRDYRVDNQGRRHDRLKDQVDSPEARSRLEITSGVAGSFRQERHVVLPNGQGAREILFRVGIKHNGTTSVDRVAVKLEKIEPVVLVGLPLSLHIMNDNPPDNQFRREFTLDAGQTEYIDVVLKQDEDDQPPSTKMIIFHIVSGVTQWVPARRYAISIYAHGNNVTPDTQPFIIDVDKAGILQFESDTSCS